jgi:predicted CoA-binding protein
MSWQQNLIDDAEGLREILNEVKRVAVLGIKTEAQQAQPAFFVPEYLQGAGYEIVPVPVYYPEVTTILGEPVYRSLEAVPGEIDMVLVFRRSQDVAKHRDELLAAHPKVVWMQTGIRNEEVARALAEAGVRVVQDRCAMVEHRRLGAERGGGMR